MINNSRGAKSYSERLRKGAKLNARLVDTLFTGYGDGNEPGVNVLLHDDNRIVLSGTRESDCHRLHLLAELTLTGPLIVANDVFNPQGQRVRSVVGDVTSR